MIGLALVGLASVVGASLKKTLVNVLENSVKADYLVTPVSNFNPEAGFPEAVANDLESLEEVDSVVRYRFGFDAIKVDDKSQDIFATNLASVGDHLDGKVRSGDLEEADPLTSVAIHVDPAKDLDVGIDDEIEMKFPDGQTETLAVAAIFEDSALYSSYMIDLALWDKHFTRKDLAFVSVKINGLSDDLSIEEKTALLEDVGETIDEKLADYPVLAENRAEFRENQQNQLNSFLIVVNVLLGLSLFIALAGITNTLALSVFERTREIGLLRAVGMSRRQLRRSIRWEAAIVSVFGALLGLVIGTVSGVAAVKAIPDTFVKDIAVPITTLIIYLVIAAIAGLAAAVGPAIRAGRMNILEAIAKDY